jgi:hypothetical protein
MAQATGILAFKSQWLLFFHQLLHYIWISKYRVWQP